MATEHLSDSDLGATVRLAWLSGADARTLGSFSGLRAAGLSLDAQAVHLGAELTDLLKAGADSNVVGKFTRLRLATWSESPIREAAPVLPVPTAASMPAFAPEVIESLVDQLAQRIRQPSRKRTQLRISVDRRPTSVTIDPEVLATFIATFGRSEVSKAAKAATRVPPAPGQSRSYQVEQALRNALARNDRQTNVIAFPASE